MDEHIPGHLFDQELEKQFRAKIIEAKQIYNEIIRQRKSIGIISRNSSMTVKAYGKSCDLWLKDNNIFKHWVGDVGTDRIIKVLELK